MRRSLVIASAVAWALGPTISISAGEPGQPGAPASKKELPLAGGTFVFKCSAAFVMRPKESERKKPQPWIWYAPTLPGLPDQHETRGHNYWEGFFRCQELVEFALD